MSRRPGMGRSTISPQMDWPRAESSAGTKLVPDTPSVTAVTRRASVAASGSPLVRGTVFRGITKNSPGMSLLPSPREISTGSMRNLNARPIASGSSSCPVPRRDRRISPRDPLFEQRTTGLLIARHGRISHPFPP